MSKPASKIAYFVGAFLLSTTAVYAQDAQQDKASVQTGSDDAIIVTAQRREQSLQEVPIAVSAFSSKDLETRQINSTLDLVNYVPNLIGHNNTSVGTANAYSLRGLSNTESISTFDPPIGTYVDDIYMARQNANNFSFFDIERIEVLRGPQGTLFGRNTTGGAINVILKKPSDHYTGYVDAGYGRYNRAQLRASVDVPVNQNLLTKISGYYVRSDGYVHDRTTGEELNGEKSWGIRGAVRALLSDSVTWDLAADYQYSSVANFPNFLDKATGERITFTPLRTDTPLGSNLASSLLADNTLGNTVKGYNFSSNLQVALDNATINIITGYRHLFQEYLTDSFAGISSSSLVTDGIYYVSSSRGFSTPLANDSWHKQFSQEIKVSGKALNGLVDYVAGFYYFNEKNTTDFLNETLPLSGAANAKLSADRTMYNGTDAYAGYAQGDVHLTHQLTFTAGIRYTDETKDIQYTPNANPLPIANPLYVPFSTQDLINVGIPVSTRAKVWTPHFSLNYQVTPDVMLYASATKGFKSGGWNARAYYASGATYFGPETIWSYEGGLRSEWLDHKLRVNLTGFYFDDMNQQLPGGGYDPTVNTIVYLTRNVADMKNYGLEAEVNFRPVDMLNVFWNGGYQHASFHNINQITLAQQATCLSSGTGCNNSIVTPSGGIAEPTRAPKFTSTLGYSINVPIADGYKLSQSAAWRYTSGTWVSTSNDPHGWQPGYSLFNAGLTLNADAGWSLGIDCSNCFNKTYRTSFLIYSYLNAPGTWMLRAGYKF